MHHCNCEMPASSGPKPYIVNVAQCAANNKKFRTTLWTGCHAQLTLMSIPVCCDIGLEIHEDTEQIIRIEQGFGLVKMGKCKNQLDVQKKVCPGDVICIPEGTWHNVINTGRTPLKLSSIYAPPHHSAETVHETKEDAQDKCNC